MLYFPGSRVRVLRQFLFVPVCVASAHAGEPESIDQVVVTATRAPAELATIGDSITLISADEARASQKTVASDLLAATPGVSVTRNGGLGAVTSVRIRGAETDQTVVLIDGVKLNDPSSASGGFNFANLLTSDIARIEVLRGAQSTLWGSQAIGGVVNIVTPEPTGALTTTVDLESGSNRTLQAIAHAQAGSERFGWRVGAGYLTTDGISAFAENLGGREDDGYRNVGVSARGAWYLSADITAEVRSTWSDGRNDFDGFVGSSLGDTPEYGKTQEWVNYGGVKIDTFAKRLSHRIGIAYTDTDRENFNPASSVPMTFDAQGTNLRYEYQGTLTLNEHFSGAFGLERETSEMYSVSPSTFNPNPAPLDRDVTIDSAYAQAQVTPFNPLTLTAGLRYDDHETFGSDTSSQLAAAWSVTASTIVRTSYGEGFKAPTLYQLYSEYGTQTLDPEESTDWDAGIEQRWFDQRVVLSATYFVRNTDNMIDFVSCFGVVSPRCASQPFGYYENVAQTHADGYELGLIAQATGRLRFTANYTGLDARNDARGTANFGKLLPRRPRDSASAALTYEWPLGVTTTLAAQYVGRSFDNATNTFVLDEYTLIDVRAAYRFSEQLELYARIENALDEQYETARRYGTLGRAGYIGVRATL